MTLTARVRCSGGQEARKQGKQGKQGNMCVHELIQSVHQRFSFVGSSVEAKERWDGMPPRNLPSFFLCAEYRLFRVSVSAPGGL